MPIFAKDIVIIPASGSIDFYNTSGSNNTSSLVASQDGGINISIPSGSSFSVSSGGTTIIESTIILSGSMVTKDPMPSVKIDSQPPSNSSLGSLWFNQDEGVTYIYYSSSTWVPLTTIPGDAITITTSSNVLIDLGLY